MLGRLLCKKFKTFGKSCSFSKAARISAASKGAKGVPMATPSM